MTRVGGFLFLAIAGCSCGSSASPDAAATSTSSSSSTSTSSSTSSSATTSASTGGGPTAPVHYIGRWDQSDPAGPKAAWPGSAIATRFHGTSLTLHLADAGTNFFSVTVDGGMPNVVSTSSATNDYVVAQGLADGDHDVWIEKQTESYVGIVQVLGLDADSGHALIPTPEPFARKIEMIGDSITCGYGDTGMGPSCTFSPDTEDEYLAYGAVSARALQAEHTSISYSGIGVYRNYDGGMTELMPARFERTFADDDGSTWDYSYTPDVVVFNLGTNDFAQGDPGQGYVDAYTAFVAQVRAHYASAAFVLASSPMLGDPQHGQELAYLMEIASSDPHAAVVDLAVQDQNANGIGCDYHPSVKTQSIMSQTLVPALQSAAGW